MYEHIGNKIKSLAIEKGIKLKELNEILNKKQEKSRCKQSFSHKLKSEAINYKEAEEIAEILGYKIIWEKIN